MTVDGDMPWRILSLADLSACHGVLDDLRRVAHVVELPADQATLLNRIPEFSAYFASLAVRVDRAVLERAGELKVIATPSTGLDHIDVAEAEARGIEIISLKNDVEFLQKVTATAELAWALLLAVVRKLPRATSAASRGEWGRDVFRGRQLSGKTLGVLGYGRLGRMVADFGHAFGMRVIACDPKPVEPAAHVTMVDFGALLRESDVVSIHIHLTDDNRRLLNADAIAQMKRGAVLINTSRGAIVDEGALLDALARGHLSGVGTDVIDGEWDADLAAHPMLRYAREHDNLVVTPHIGGVTHESQTMAMSHTAGKLKQWLETHATHAAT